MSFTKDTLGTTESVGGVSLFESLRSNQNASGSYSGLMSAGDKAKLDGIEEGANKYIHPDSLAEVGTYMQVVTDEQGHVVGGRLLQDSMLADYRIVDAYITDNKEIVLGAKRLRPQMPGENISWKQVVERPNTIAGYGIKDAYIAERLTGTINEKNLPARLQIELAGQQYADGIDAKVEALKTISYENFRYLFDEMKNMADTIALLAKQLSNMQSKLDNMSGSGGSGGTCQCTDEDVQDTDVDQIFN
jgi:hypothetical protein